MSYDAWLEAPYQKMYAEDDAFFDWCESEGVDPDSADAYEEWEAAMEAAAEAHAEEQAEANHYEIYG